MQQLFGSRSLHVLWLPVLACLLWLGLTVGLYRHAAQVEEAHRLELEHTRLATVAQQHLDARNWNAVHGGVYVPESAYDKPNPWLPVRKRTLQTVDGRTLVLVNPAYMSRQLAESNSQPGIRIAVISNRPLRPENQSDAWEKEAITQCAEGRVEIFSPPDANGQRRLRFLSVLIAQKSCLRCHADSQEGEVLGGISVSQEAEPYFRNAARQERNMRLVYVLLGLTGVLGIGGLTLNLAQRRWQAEETSRMKSAFMARLSHDMRTPLTAILGMSELLLKGGASPRENKRALRYLTQAGGALLEMVSDISDHAALEQGGLTLREKAFGLRETLAQCLDIYRPAAEARNIELRLSVPDDLPDDLLGDAFRLRQALGNLISNAVKFTEQGEVRVTVRAGNTRHSRLTLQISVQDSGPGLQLEERERIFESFQRGSRAGGEPGTGLGLNIARTIARRMGGDVRVDTRPGPGACFVLEVVLRQNTAQRKENAATGHTAGKGDARSAGLLRGRRILAAEDNATSRSFLEHVLQGEGAHTRMTADGAATLAALAEGPWDLVLLDARMPGPDGLEVLRRIRQGLAGVAPNQRVIIYTAALDAADQERCRRLKPDGILLKPVSFARLRSELESLLDPKPAKESGAHEDGGKQPRKQDQPEDAESAANALPVWDREAALAAVDNDRELLEHLLAVLRVDLRETAAQLRAAVAAGEVMTIRRLAHSCKNSAATLRLVRLQQAAARTGKAASASLAAAADELQAAVSEALALLHELEQGQGGGNGEQF
ncbi:ATP-binding protein [Desulfovibrio sp. ZJ369]|uniref:ATP-binding protein n=1 Tax=Desulfovibrio sp. ZJ369 TaxID=2709793 RepID=UPI0013EA6408|nr:ATP-binding protein [Desulfovibrio sp. ZJ369]